MSLNIFLVTGCMLLVIKLATAADFSWLWVVGTMFAPFWLILGCIATVVALVLATVCLVMALAIVAAPFFFMWLGWSEYQDHRRWIKRKAMFAEMQRQLTSTKT